MRPADTSGRPEQTPGEVSGAVVRRVLKRLSSAALTLEWQAFLGACLLAGAALLPHAPLRPVLAGMAVAGLIHYAWLKLAVRRNGGK